MQRAVLDGSQTHLSGSGELCEPASNLQVDVAKLGDLPTQLKMLYDAAKFFMNLACLQAGVIAVSPVMLEHWYCHLGPDYHTFRVS